VQQQPAAGGPSYEDLLGMLVELRGELAQVRAENVALRAENAELRRRLGLDSSNSSKPPSSDGLSRAMRRSASGGSGRGRGKQRGAPGSTLRLVDDPDVTVVCRPDRCAWPGCGADLVGVTEYGRQRRQVFDLPVVKAHVTEYLLVAVSCGCGHVTAGQAPDQVTGRAQYGPGTKAAAVYARGAQFLPYGRAARLMADLLGVPVSAGFVHQVVGEAAKRLGPFVTRMRALLHVVDVLHVDETPTRFGGGLSYVHVACTDVLTLMHVGGRSKADIDAGGVLPGFDGTIVRDGYAGYQHLTDADHAWCGAHLIRDLRGVHDADLAGQGWAQVMAGTLLMAKKWTEQAAADGRAALTAEQVSELRACYAGALAYGREQNPPEATRGVGAKLVDRFDRHQDMIMRFVVDLAVPFTNNQAERDLRPVKLQQKISATWRTLQGLADFAVLRSYLSTAAKHGQDTLDVLKQLFTTGPWMPPAATTSR
jgi:transposase